MLKHENLSTDSDGYQIPDAQPPFTLSFHWESQQSLPGGAH